MIQLSKERFRELLIAEERLSRLERGGVDNWKWYHESLNPEDEITMEQFEEKINNLS